MTMDELAACDAAERRRLHDKAVADVRREIEINRDRHARTDVLERHLARLCAQEIT